MKILILLKILSRNSNKTNSLKTTEKKLITTSSLKNKIIF